MRARVQLALCTAQVLRNGLAPADDRGAGADVGLRPRRVRDMVAVRATPGAVI